LEPSIATASLVEIPGLVGPKDLSVETWREYDFGGRVYRIHNPVALYFRKGDGTTHRIVDSEGIVHCVPAPGFNGTVLRWQNRPELSPAVAF
jgi:hypothetical protein